MVVGYYHLRKHPYRCMCRSRSFFKTTVTSRAILDPWPRTLIRSAPLSPTINMCFFGEVNFVWLWVLVGWSGFLVGKLACGFGFCTWLFLKDLSQGAGSILFQQVVSTCALHLWTLIDPFSSLQKGQDLRDGKAIQIELFWGLSQ